MLKLSYIPDTNCNKVWATDIKTFRESFSDRRTTRYSDVITKSSEIRNLQNTLRVLFILSKSIIYQLMKNRIALKEY